MADVGAETETGRSCRRLGNLHRQSRRLGPVLTPDTTGPKATGAQKTTRMCHVSKKANNPDFLEDPFQLLEMSTSCHGKSLPGGTGEDVTLKGPVGVTL